MKQKSSKRLTNRVNREVAKLISLYAEFEVRRALLPCALANEIGSGVPQFRDRDKRRIEKLLNDACEAHMDAKAIEINHRLPGGTADEVEENICAKAKSAIVLLCDALEDAAARIVERKLTK